MSKENESNELKQDVAEMKKESKPKKELTPQEIQKRKKMLIYPLFFLIFAGAMWLIFAPTGNKEEKQPNGFNPELPVPKDEGIVSDKRSAYEQEAMQNKQKEKMRSLQDFALLVGEENNQQQEKQNNKVAVIDYEKDENDGHSFGNCNSLQSSAYAYQDINRQLTNWYNQPETNSDENSLLGMESRIQELELKLEDATRKKSAADEQLELIEKSYAIAAKYVPNGQVTHNEQQATDGTGNVAIQEKVIPKTISGIRQNVVSLLATPIGNDEFLEQYSKPRNMGFITVAGNDITTNKNSIRACVYKTITLSNGKELQLRLLEPIRAGNILIPANTILVGSAKIGGERLQVTITSIQYADNVIPVEMSVYDIDGMQGIFIPNSDEVTAMKEIAANMGTSMGSSITITDDAGSQLAADISRSAIQGVSQFFSKKMREVKVTLKAGYKVLLLPKA